MRILVVTHYFPEHGGGVEIAALHIVQGLISRGFDIEWIASREPHIPSSRAPGAHSVRALNLSERLFGVPYPVWGPDALRAIDRALQRCDVVHLHDSLYIGNLLAYVRAKRCGKPIVVTQHVGLVPYRNPLLRGAMDFGNRVLSARVLSGSTTIVFYSKTTEGYFSRMLPGHVRQLWIPNGLDESLYRALHDEQRHLLRAELGWPADEPVLLFVGRYVEKKGLGILEQLVSRFPTARWMFVGWGPRDPSAWQSSNVVNFGRRPHHEIARFYQAADLLVLPSVGEGLPLVVQESLACGTPVVVSTEVSQAHPGLQDVAWSAEPSVEGFATLLDDLLQHPEHIRARRVECTEFARREWNWDACADRYAALMVSLRATEGQ
jgi:glycosyltransferase involved in cell wall biosynthesis